MSKHLETTRLNDKFMAIEEAMIHAPLGMLTIVMPTGVSTFEIHPEDVEERRVFREGECIKCANGIATYEDLYSTKTVYATNGADMNEEVWLTVSEQTKELWIALFNAGLLQNSILGEPNDPSTWYANPLDVFPVEMYESFDAVNDTDAKKA